MKLCSRLTELCYVYLNFQQLYFPNLIWVFAFQELKYNVMQMEVWTIALI
jgi:hypothetical protein